MSQDHHVNTFLKTNMSVHGIDQGGKVIAEYIWIDGTGINLRAKCRTLDSKVEKVEDIPEWNYDGSSTYQAETKNSEILLKPVAFFRDPFRQGDNIMVMCETWKWEDNTYQKQIPANTNFRHFSKKIFDQALDEEPWYGIEQEYSLLGTKNRFTIWPLGWPSSGYPGQQGPYYCSVGANVCFGRAIADDHYKACLYAGITISGTNAEVMPGQWEYQVGPVQGIAIGDHLFVSRYLLHRVAENYGVNVSFDPKLFGDWNGSGCHTNFSTKTMRSGEKGMAYIEEMLERFSKKHREHIAVYGAGNDKRLTGHHETSSVNEFSYGCGNRAASFRIPTSVMHAQGKGYIEDRRPSSNVDPYIVGAMLVDTGILGEEKSQAKPMLDHYNAWSQWLETAEIENV